MSRKNRERDWASTQQVHSYGDDAHLFICFVGLFASSINPTRRQNAEVFYTPC